MAEAGAQGVAAPGAVLRQRIATEVNAVGAAAAAAQSALRRSAYVHGAQCQAVANANVR